MDILIGCDPEVFVRKNGTFLSAHGLIKGDKKNPQQVNHGAVQVDGMALEFNINPASTTQEFLFNVQSVMQTLKGMVPEYEVVVAPVADFDMEYMKQQPMEALELGCDPDFNGWTGNANIKPDGDRPFRTASGHIHVGWTEGEDISQGSVHFTRSTYVAKEMDFYLGLASMLYDSDTRRRSMYGRAGCFRPKPYGMEYRTLSNMWLNSEATITWVFSAAKTCMQNMLHGKQMLSDKYGDIQDIINTSDIKAAKRIIYKEDLEVPYGV